MCLFNLIEIKNTPNLYLFINLLLLYMGVVREHLSGVGYLLPLRDLGIKFRPSGFHEVFLMSPFANPL